MPTQLYDKGHQLVVHPISIRTSIPKFVLEEGTELLSDIRLLKLFYVASPPTGHVSSSWYKKCLGTE